MSWKLRAVNLWRRHIKPLVFIVVLFLAFRSAIADWNDVPTGSMKPTIIEGDRIFVNKLAYDLKVPFLGTQLIRWGDPERGDVVVFFSPLDGTRLVKRVIGVPGDVVAMRNNRLLINGQTMEYGELDRKYIEQVTEADQRSHEFASEILGQRSHPMMTSTASWSEYRDTETFTVPPGHYFVLGDNRDHSADSRRIGMIPRDKIVGRASGIVWSLDLNKHLSPRWDRFFRSLP